MLHMFGRTLKKTSTLIHCVASGVLRPVHVGIRDTDADDLDEAGEGGDAKNHMSLLQPVPRMLAETKKAHDRTRENWPHKSWQTYGLRSTPMRVPRGSTNSGRGR